MEHQTPPVGGCVPVSTAGFRQSDPQLFWTPQRVRTVKEADKQRLISALLSEYGARDIVSYLFSRRDYQVVMEIIDETLLEMESGQ